MNNAVTLLLILLGIVGIIILCVIVPPLQTIIGIGSGIGALALLIITLKKIHRSMQLKEYFWQIFPDCDKDYLNNGFIRRGRRFQNERKEKLLQCDPQKGKELLALESHVNPSLFAIVVMIMIATAFIRF
jgi:ABC-type antimicrobial peptide transport system permease subunit